MTHFIFIFITTSPRKGHKKTQRAAIVEIILLSSSLLEYILQKLQFVVVVVVHLL